MMINFWLMDIIKLERIIFLSFFCFLYNTSQKLYLKNP